MTLDEAIEIVNKWYAGGYATRIEDMNPAVKLVIESSKQIEHLRYLGMLDPAKLLPGETEEKQPTRDEVRRYMLEQQRRPDEGGLLTDEEINRAYMGVDYHPSYKLTAEVKHSLERVAQAQRDLTASIKDTFWRQEIFREIERDLLYIALEYDGTPVLHLQTNEKKSAQKWQSLKDRR